MADVNSTLIEACNEIALALQVKLNTDNKFKPINYAARVLDIGSEANAIASDVKLGKKVYVGDDYVDGTFEGIDLNVSLTSSIQTIIPPDGKYYKKVVVPASTGGGGGSTDCDGCIIEVEELPTENIDTTVLYMIKGKRILVDFSLGSEIPSLRAYFEGVGFTFNILEVDELPTENIMESNDTQIYLYYISSLNVVYQYRDGAWENATLSGATPIFDGSGDSYYKWIEEFKDVIIVGNGSQISLAEALMADGVTVELFYVDNYDNVTDPRPFDEAATTISAYYDASRDDVFVYEDGAWVSYSQFDGLVNGGAITNISQATTDGCYYALIKTGWEEYTTPTPPKLQEKTATSNGEIVADEGYDGLSKVTVDVPIPDDYVKPNGVIQQCTVCTEGGVKRGDFIEKVHVLGNFMPDIGLGGFKPHAAYKIDDSRFILVGHSDASSKLIAIVISADDSGYSYGQPLTIAEGISSTIVIEKVRENTVLIAYNSSSQSFTSSNIITAVLSVNGLELSMGTSYTVTTIYDSASTNLTYLHDDKLLISYADVSKMNDEYCYVSARVLTINDTQISIGQKSTILLGIDYGSVWAVGLDSKDAFLVYRDPLNDRYSCCLATVSGTTVSFDNQQAFPLAFNASILFTKLDCTTVGCIRRVYIEENTSSGSNIYFDTINVYDNTVAVADSAILFTFDDLIYTLNLRPLKDAKYLCWMSWESGNKFCVFDVTEPDFAPIMLEQIELESVSDSSWCPQYEDMVYFDKTGAQFAKSFSDDSPKITGSAITNTRIIFNKTEKTFVVPATSNSKNVGIAITDAAKAQLVDGAFC